MAREQSARPFTALDLSATLPQGRGPGAADANFRSARLGVAKATCLGRSEALAGDVLHRGSLATCRRHPGRIAARHPPDIAAAPPGIRCDPRAGSRLRRSYGAVSARGMPTMRPVNRTPP